MSQWPIQRNVFPLSPQTSPMNKSIETTTHILTAHNTNTPTRISTTSNIFDDSLTNLSWLHDTNILKRTIPTINSSSSGSLLSSINNSSNSQIVSQHQEQSSSTSLTLSSLGAVYPNDIDDNHDLNLNNDEQWKMYKTNPQAKPVYSYSQLILLALQHSGYDKMTFQMIYEWVAENFPYFKKMEPTWQNSIRQNLSLNKCFIKVPRTKKETGSKGGYWRISPDYERQCIQKSLPVTNQKDEQINLLSNKRVRSSKRSTNVSGHIKQLTNVIKSETWIDPILPSKNQIITLDRSYVRMPSSFLSPISSPNSLTVPSTTQQQINESSSVLSPSPSSPPSSMSSALGKQNFTSTKFDETDMLLLDSVTFDWDAYLCETPNDLDVQPFLITKTEQDLFNDFNAALTDLTYSAEIAAAGGDANAFDGFDYQPKHSTFSSLFEEDDQQQQQQQPSLKIKGRGIKRPSWWLTNESVSPTKLPSLEIAFDLKLSK